MARFEQIDLVPAMQKAKPSIDLTGREVKLKFTGFTDGITYPLPDATGLVAPGVTQPVGNFECMEDFGTLIKRSSAVVLPSLVYTLKVDDRAPIVLAGVNRLYAPQLIQRAFLSWGGIARMRAEGPGSLLVNGQPQDEYVLDASKGREIHFIQM